MTAIDYLVNAFTAAATLGQARWFSRDRGEPQMQDRAIL